MIKANSTKGYDVTFIGEFGGTLQKSTRNLPPIEIKEKEVMTIEVGENESSKHWLGILNSMKSRGVKDVTKEWEPQYPNALKRWHEN